MNPLYASYAALGGAITFELAGTTFLGKSEQFTKLAPSLLSVACYAVSFYLLSQALKQLPLGIAYAIWAGLGIVLTAIITVTVFKQRLDAIALIGIAFIVIGVVLIQAFSKSFAH
jgi:small multidrug resistance pump